MSAKLLHLGASLNFPLTAVTETVGIVGKRGSGKTHTAVVLVEELLEHGLRVVVLDPIGVWWGLRSSADGKSAGYSILTLGGRHGDLPLEASNGALVARFVVEKNTSVLLDLGEMSKGDQQRFVTDFLEQLYRQNRAPLHVVIDEADAFAPQRIIRGAERCFGAVDQAVRRGRARGLGVTLVTQRSAAINKDVLTQVEVLVAHRTIAPQDRKAIEAWVEVHGDEDKRKRVLETLHVLEKGEAWVWSPAWLEILQRVKIRPRRTFDSSATPTTRAAAAPKGLAAVDITSLGAELAALVEKQRAEDPRALRTRIAELERQLAKPAGKPAPTIRTVEKVRVVERPALTKKQLQELHHVGDRAFALSQAIEDLARTIAHQPAPAAESRGSTVLPGPAFRVDRGDGRRSPKIVMSRAVQAPPAIASAELSGYARGLLRVLAERHPTKLTRGQIATLAGRRLRSSSFDQAMAAIARSGCVRRVDDRYELTAEGVAVSGAEASTIAPAGPPLEVWRRALPGYARLMLDAIVAAPRGLTRLELSEKIGRPTTSSSFQAAVATLRQNGLVETQDDRLVASEVLS